MATSWLQPKTALQALILLVACGCTPFESHGPAHEGTELEALAPIGTAYSSLWTQWVKVDAPQLPESSGELCTAADAGTSANVCVNGGLIRKVKIPSETSCAAIQKIEDNLGVFKWDCVNASDGSGLWIYSIGFLENKGISDLIENPSTSLWKVLSVRIETSNNKYLSKPTRAWGDKLTAAPDSSSERKNLNQLDVLYYIDADTSGEGFAFTGNNVGLILLNGAKYTYTGAVSNPVIEAVNRKFIYLEGSFDGGGNASDVVSFTENSGSSAFVFLNRLDVTGGTSDGLYFGGQAHNLLITNLKASNNGDAGFKWNGSGDYVEISFVETNDNGDAGVTINGGNNVSITDLVSEGNGAAGASLLNIDGITVSNAILSNNGSDGLNLTQVNDGEFSDLSSFENTKNGIQVSSNGTNLKFVSVTASNNDESGLLLDGGPTTSGVELTDIIAHENGAHGVYLKSDVQNISGSGIQANKNAEHGLLIDSAVDGFVMSHLFFSENVKDGLHIAKNPTGVELTNVESRKSGNNGVTIRQGATVTIEGLKIIEANQIGLLVADNPTSANLKDVEISGSASDGLKITIGAIAELTGLDISNSGGSGIHLLSPGMNSKFSNVSITNSTGYAIYIVASGSDAEFSNVSVEQTSGDAVHMEQGGTSTFNEIYFNQIPEYLFSATLGATIEVFDLSYGSEVDPGKISFTDTGGQVNVR